MMKKSLLLLSVVFIVSCFEDAEPVKYTLTTTVSPAESGIINPKGGTVDDGQELLLNAVPASEYIFDKWLGDITGTDNPINISMDSDKNITGVFKLKPYVYYPFNGDTKDYSGNNIHSESYNTELTEDRFGNKNFAYKFNGVNSVIKVNNPSNFILSNESFSISIWVKIIDNEPTYRVFFIISNKDAFPRFELMKARSTISNGGIYAELMNNDNEESEVWSKMNGEELPKNEWIHLVVVADQENSLFHLYINAVLQQSSKLVEYSLPTKDEIMVRFGETTWSNNIFNRQRHNGSIDDFRMFKHALSVQDINRLYKEKIN